MDLYFTRPEIESAEEGSLGLASGIQESFLLLMRTSFESIAALID